MAAQMDGATARGVSRHKLELLVEASAALLGPHAVEEILPSLLETARNLTGAMACAIWRRSADAHTWQIVEATGLSQEFRAVQVPDSTMEEIGDQPICYEDVYSATATSRRATLYEMEGISSFVAVPLKIRGRRTGTLTFYYRDPHCASAEEMSLPTVLANLAASAIETAELYREQERHRLDAEHGRVRSAFLAEASAVLASSLDYEATLASVAHLAVPHIADWCLVEILQDDGTLKNLAVAHPDPEKIELARDLRKRYPADPNNPSAPARVVQSGKPLLAETISDEQLVRFARDEEHLAILRSLGFTSFMCVPVELRGRSLGTISFVSAELGRKYGAEDLSLAEDLARRAAVAIENARLYQSVRRERGALSSAITALRENEERLRMALDAGRMGIWDWNVRTNDLEWSEALLAMHGFEAGKFDNRFETFVSAIHPDDRASFLATLDRALKDKSYYQTEFRVVFPDASIHWVAGRGRVFSDPEGNAVRMIGIGLDITERHTLEETLRNSQKLESIGLLAGGVAHDFNNLLTGILGNASLAVDMLRGQGPAIPLIQSVIEASERAAGLTQQLLAYSGKGKFLVEPIDVSSLVRDISNLMRTSIPKLVHMDLQLAPDLLWIEADASQIQQVIMNLVINAAEAIGDRPGSVWVRTGLELIDEISGHRFTGESLGPGKYVYVEVQDTGCGIDTETQSRIFDPFFTTKFTGRGLGLAAVSGVVRGHRGAIRIRSAPGQGSTFRVLFPACEALQEPVEHNQLARNLRGCGLVLVIDDEASVRAVAESALRYYGYRVMTAKNGAEGVQLFQRSPADFRAVILDLTMPVMGGEDALRLIKSIRPDIPVIASSGYSELEANGRFGERDLAGFLQKPYTGAAVARKLKETASSVMGKNTAR